MNGQFDGIVLYRVQNNDDDDVQNGSHAAFLQWQTYNCDMTDSGLHTNDDCDT